MKNNYDLFGGIIAGGENHNLEEIYMSFSDKVKDEAKKHSGGLCSICNRRPVQMYHHLDPEKRENTPEECVPVCGYCHTLIHHGSFTRDMQKYTRDAHYEWVKLTFTKDEIDRNIELSKMESDISELKQIVDKQYNDFINYINEPNPDPQEVETKASSLATSVYISSSAIEYWKKSHKPTSQWTTPAFDPTITSCGKCGEKLESQEEIAGICTRRGCSEKICIDCFKESKYCDSHSHSRVIRAVSGLSSKHPPYYNNISL